MSKYVSPEYQAQLDHLAETLCDPVRFKPVAEVALDQTVQLELFVPENVVLGIE